MGFRLFGCGAFGAPARQQSPQRRRTQRLCSAGGCSWPGHPHAPAASGRPSAEWPADRVPSRQRSARIVLDAVALIEVVIRSIITSGAAAPPFSIACASAREPALTTAQPQPPSSLRMPSRMGGLPLSMASTRKPSEVAAAGHGCGLRHDIRRKGWRARQGHCEHGALAGLRSEGKRMIEHPGNALHDGRARARAPGRPARPDRACGIRRRLTFCLLAGMPSPVSPHPEAGSARGAGAHRQSTWPGGGGCTLSHWRSGSASAAATACDRIARSLRVRRSAAGKPFSAAEGSNSARQLPEEGIEPEHAEFRFHSRRYRDGEISRSARQDLLDRIEGGVDVLRQIREAVLCGRAPPARWR